MLLVILRMSAHLNALRLLLIFGIGYIYFFIAFFIPRNQPKVENVQVSLVAFVLISLWRSSHQAMTHEQAL